MLHDDNFWKAVAFAVLASFGGALGYIMRSIDNNAPIKIGFVFVQAGAAGFVGMLVYLSCVALNLSDPWTGVIVGVCGWLGANSTIRILEKLVYKKLGVDGKPDTRRGD